MENYLTKVLDEAFDSKLAIVRGFTQEAIAKTLSENHVDVILAHADARMASVAAVAGHAVGTLPLGFADFNGRAFGLNVIAGEKGERKILQVMSAWEQSFPEAQAVPPRILAWDREHL